MKKPYKTKYLVFGPNGNRILTNQTPPPGSIYLMNPDLRRVRGKQLHEITAADFRDRELELWKRFVWFCTGTSALGLLSLLLLKWVL